MLDIKRVRANFDEVKEKLSKRGEDLRDFDKFDDLDEKTKRIDRENRSIKAERNEVSAKSC